MHFKLLASRLASPLLGQASQLAVGSSWQTHWRLLPQHAALDGFECPHSSECAYAAWLAIPVPRNNKWSLPLALHTMLRSAASIRFVVEPCHMMLFKAQTCHLQVFLRHDAHSQDVKTNSTNVMTGFHCFWICCWMLVEFAQTRSVGFQET